MNIGNKVKLISEQATNAVIRTSDTNILKEIYVVYNSVRYIVKTEQYLGHCRIKTTS